MTVWCLETPWRNLSKDFDEAMNASGWGWTRGGRTAGDSFKRRMKDCIEEGVSIKKKKETDDRRYGL